jgi:hypothetical protein
MKRIVFYSRHSDLESQLNGSLIEGALERALQPIKQNAVTKIEPAVGKLALKCDLGFSTAAMVYKDSESVR